MKATLNAESLAEISAATTADYYKWISSDENSRHTSRIVISADSGASFAIKLERYIQDGYSVVPLYHNCNGPNTCAIVKPMRIQEAELEELIRKRQRSWQDHLDSFIHPAEPFYCKP